MCNNDYCKQIHEEKHCFVKKLCKTCNRVKTYNHVCENEKWCHNCKKAVDKNNHRCFILTELQKKKRKSKKKKSTEPTHLGYIFFDYEATQENRQHEANLICAYKVCLNCIEKVNDDCKHKCGRFEFQDNNNFCSWLFKQRKFTAMAHNMQGYDGVFILNYIINNILASDLQPKVILRGSKILSIKFRNVRIIDTYNFIPIALAEFSTAFTLSELKKGYFPHLFNTKANQNYKGPYPEKKFYGVEFMSSEKLRLFDEWYATKTNEIFDFKEEFRGYCWSDVMLMATGNLFFKVKTI